MHLTMKHLCICIYLGVFLGGAQAIWSQESTEDQSSEIATKSDAMVKLDSLIGGAELWARDATSLETEFKEKGFAWLNTTSKRRAVIRPPGVFIEKSHSEVEDASESKGVSEDVGYQYIRQRLEIFGKPAHDATLEFAEGKLSNVTISVWNKGDAHQGLSEAQFTDMAAFLVKAIDAALKIRGSDMGKDSSTGVPTSRFRWETPETLAQLEFSSSRTDDRAFQAEFIRVRLLPRPRSLIGGNAALVNANRVRAEDLLKNIKRSVNGDVYIANLPMVDQGQKGYCAVASAERVLRYYGLRVDQHELANAASTSAWGGTKPSEFEDALHSMRSNLKVKVRDLISFDEREFKRLVQSYNREAKRMGGRNWPEDNYYFEANPDILREAKCGNNAYEKFYGFVVAATDRGLPLLWALQLGRYPETGLENPQGGGGHMRSIIGYNAKTDEVIFTDSWGAGHEFKKMKGRDACAATQGLYLIELGQ